MFSSDFVAAVDRSSLVGVSAGTGRTAPLEIWVVTVGSRLFARSWGLAERSWYSAFRAGARGFLECQGQRVPVFGREPPDIGAITPLIDAAYLRKYDRGENANYARGILGEQHVRRTLEFIACPESLLDTAARVRDEPG